MYTELRNSTDSVVMPYLDIISACNVYQALDVLNVDSAVPAASNRRKPKFSLQYKEDDVLYIILQPDSQVCLKVSRVA